MRRLALILVILLVLGAACTPKPPDSTPVDEPGENPGQPHDPSNHEPKPKPSPDEEPGTVAQEPGATAEEELLQPVPLGDFPTPRDVAASGMDTDMMGWVQEDPEGWDVEFPNLVFSTVHEDTLLFITVPAITAMSMSTGEILWKRKFPSGFGFCESSYMDSPEPVGNTLTYLIERIPYDGIDEEYWEQICLDTGEIIWTGQERARTSSYQDSYYRISSPGTLARFNSHNERVWEIELGMTDYFTLINSYWDYDGDVLLLIDGPRLYAVNSKDGKLLWEQENCNIVGFLDRQVVLKYDQELLLVDILSGKVLLNLQCASDADFFVWGEGLYLSDATRLKRIDLVTGMDIWELDFPGIVYMYTHQPWGDVNTLWCFGGPDDPELYAIDPEAGELIMTYCPAARYYTILIKVARDLQGRTYVCHYDYDLDVPEEVVFDAVTGKVLWKIPYDGRYVYGDSAPSNYLILDTEDGDLKYFNLITGKVEFQTKAPGVPLYRVGDNILMKTEDKILFLSPPRS